MNGRNVVFGNTIEGKGRVGTEILCAIGVPVFVSIAAFPVVIVVIDSAFGPAGKEE